MLKSNVCQPMTKWYSLMWYPLYFDFKFQYSWQDVMQTYSVVLVKTMMGYPLMEIMTRVITVKLFLSKFFLCKTQIMSKLTSTSKYTREMVIQNWKRFENILEHWCQNIHPPGHAQIYRMHCWHIPLHHDFFKQGTRETALIFTKMNLKFWFKVVRG